MLDIPLHAAGKLFGISCLAVAAGEAIPAPLPEYSLVMEAGKLTLVGVLALAVVVLWKALNAEREARNKQGEEFTSFLKSIHQQRELEIRERDHD